MFYTRLEQALELYNTGSNHPKRTTKEAIEKLENEIAIIKRMPDNNPRDKKQKRSSDEVLLISCGVTENTLRNTGYAPNLCRVLKECIEQYKSDKKEEKIRQIQETKFQKNRATARIYETATIAELQARLETKVQLQEHHKENGYYFYKYSKLLESNGLLASKAHISAMPTTKQSSQNHTTSQSSRLKLSGP